MPMITRADDFFTLGCGRCERFATPDCSSRPFIAGLDGLRRLCLDMGLVETVKWAHPCYMHAARNIALIGAFRSDFRLTFLNAELLTDAEGALEPQGPNSRVAGMMRFTAVSDVEEKAPLIRGFLRQLMDHAEAGTPPPRRPAREFDLPDELVEALDADPELADAFNQLTPGRQRSYLFNLAQAKQPETRRARIEKFRPKIIAGKGALDR